MLRRITRATLVFIVLMLITPMAAFADYAWECRGGKFVVCDWKLASGLSNSLVPFGESGFVPVRVAGVVVDWCVYRVLDPQPGPDDVLWAGGDPEHGRLWQKHCTPSDGSASSSTESAFAYQGIMETTYYVPDGQFPDGSSPANPGPADLVVRALGQLRIPVPGIGIGPDAGRVAVKFPVVLSVVNGDSIVRTTVAGLLSVTVTAELVDTVWQLGEPVDVRVPDVLPDPLVCAGAGTDGNCRYSYRWRSLPERTLGVGAWPVTVTANWRVSWRLSTGQTGTETYQLAGTTTLKVREWQTILVTNNH